MTVSPASIVVIGEALMDVVETGDDEPRLARPGGSPYNVAVGLARLGQHAVFAGRLSRDPLGSILRRHAERSGVDLVLAVDTAEPTTVALVELVDSQASYRFGIDGTADFGWTDAELAAIPDDGLAAVHFGSLASWTPPAGAAILRRVGQLRERLFVSYDPNVRPRLQPDRDAARADIERAVALADLVKTSDEDLAWLYPGVAPADVAQQWLGLGPGLVVVTRGDDGSVAYSARRTVRRPVVAVDVVDTVGAGDAYTSGLLDALARRGLLRRGGAGDVGGIDDTTLAAILDDAAEVAAITCSRAGANPPRAVELRRG